MPDTVGTGGGTGVARVTEDDAYLIHELSIVFLTLKVYTAGGRPENVGLDW